jgi:plasmid maintenance system antidote protein VapI
MIRERKSVHPGIILKEDVIKPLCMPITGAANSTGSIKKNSF